jgi:hypothetical protein
MLNFFAEGGKESKNWEVFNQAQEDNRKGSMAARPLAQKYCYR